MRRPGFRLMAVASVFFCGACAGLFLNDIVLVGGAEASGDSYEVVSSKLPDMVERVSPAVVTVGAVKKQRFIDPWRSSFFRPYIVEREAREPFLGSGFLVDHDGTIVTNFHVIEHADRVFVTLDDGSRIDAEVLGADPYTDVAVLRVDVDRSDLPEPMQLGDSDRLRIAETVLTFGNPFGNLIEDPRPTVTRGVISALHRSFRPDASNRVYHDMIQTDAAINPGNSGGPLVDELGRAIGMNAFIMSRSGGSNGLGFAIPINRVKAIVDEISEHGRIRPTVKDFDVMELRTPRVSGLLIRTMVKNGPAEKAGLDLGDVIIGVEGRPVTSGRELAVVLASRSPGETIRLEIWRSGDIKTIDYVVEEARERITF